VRGQIPKIEPVFSWHNPTREVLAKSLNFELPDFVNVYHHHFLKKAHYLSDSNLRYSIPQWEKLLVGSERSVLHLLFHPLNWVVGGRDMSEVLAGTWRYIIRERELEVGLNQTYKKLYPSGMPNAVLEAFSREWTRLAREPR
jgi:hypothetical protein